MSRFQSFNADKLVSRFATHSQCAGRSPVEVAIAASQRAAPRRRLYRLRCRSGHGTEGISSCHTVKGNGSRITDLPVSKFLSLSLKTHATL